jgi:hypothetical protein
VKEVVIGLGLAHFNKRLTRAGPYAVGFISDVTLGNSDDNV